MGTKEHRLARLGYLGTAAVAIRGVVGLLGDLDFVVGEAEHPKWTRPVVDLILAPPGYLILPILCLSVAAIWWDYRKGPIRIPPMTPLTIAIFFSLAFVCAWGYYFWDRSQGPIVWIDDENSPLSFTRSGDSPTYVYAFQIKGANRSSDPISPIDAFVRSNINGAIIPLQFNADGRPVSEKVIAPSPNGDFVLIAVLPSTLGAYSGGLTLAEFRRDFGSFTINFTYEGGPPIARRIDRAKVDKLLESGNKVIEATRPKPPSLLPKSKVTVPTPNPTSPDVAAPKSWTDDISDWSVSIETLPLFHFIPDKKIAVFQQFRLINVSAKHKRIIDLEIVVPPNGDEAPGIAFKTEFYRDTGYRKMLREAGKENASRGWAFLDSPIELKPGQMVEGQIDFILPDSVVPVVTADPTRLRMESTTITVIDRISGNKLELLLGEHFNAIKGEKTDPRKSEPPNKGIFRSVFPEPVPGKPRPPGTRPEDVTFSDLLFFEFPNMVRMSSERLERGEFANAKFAEFVVVQDNMSRSEFYAVYTMENAQTFEVCKWFADNYKALREEWRPAKPQKKGFGIEPGGANNDFPFTGQFYIYHEGELTTEQQKEIWNLYDSKGMNVTFRGPKYLKEKKEWLGPHLHK